MERVDRLLLYVVSAVLAAILIAGEQGESDSDARGAEVGREAAIALMATESASDSTTPVQDRPSVSNEVDAGTNERIELVDSEGRHRLELFINDNDEPQFLMRGPEGEVQLHLSTSADGTARISLGESDSGHITISGNSDGDQVLELVGREGATTRLTLTSDGSAELRLSGRHSGDELLVYQDSLGLAKIGLRSGSHDGNVSVQLDSSGMATLGLIGPDGNTGPVLNVFDDGLAEIAINGSSSDSGPSMIRMPDGLSIISARLPNGDPGASMVTAPDGRAVVAATNSDGSQQVELRIDESGVPSFGVVSPDEPPEQSPDPEISPDDDKVSLPSDGISGTAG